MLVGVRKSWASRPLTVREDTVEYGAEYEEIDKARDKARDKDCDKDCSSEVAPGFSEAHRS